MSLANVAPACCGHASVIGAPSWLGLIEVELQDGKFDLYHDFSEPPFEGVMKREKKCTVLSNTANLLLEALTRSLKLRFAVLEHSVNNQWDKIRNNQK